jgi:hypothetical protein
MSFLRGGRQPTSSCRRRWKKTSCPRRKRTSWTAAVRACSASPGTSITGSSYTSIRYVRASEWFFTLKYEWIVNPPLGDALPRWDHFVGVKLFVSPSLGLDIAAEFPPSVLPSCVISITCTYHHVHHRHPTPFFFYNNQRVFTPNARGMTKQKFPRWEDSFKCSIIK